MLCADKRKMFTQQDATNSQAIRGWVFQCDAVERNIWELMLECELLYQSHVAVVLTNQANFSMCDDSQKTEVSRRSLCPSVCERLNAMERWGTAQLSLCLNNSFRWIPILQVCSTSPFCGIHHFDNNFSKLSHLRSLWHKQTLWSGNVLVKR